MRHVALSLADCVLACHQTGVVHTVVAPCAFLTAGLEPCRYRLGKAYAGLASPATPDHVAEAAAAEAAGGPGGAGGDGSEATSAAAGATAPSGSQAARGVLLELAKAKLLSAAKQQPKNKEVRASVCMCMLVHVCTCASV